MPNNPKENASETPSETPRGINMSRREAVIALLKVAAVTGGAVLAQPKTAEAVPPNSVASSAAGSITEDGNESSRVVTTSATTAHSGAEAQAGLPDVKEGVLPAVDVLQIKTVGGKVVWLEQNGGLYAANFDQETNVWSEKVVLVQPLSPENNPSQILSFDATPSIDGQHSIVLKTTVTGDPGRTEIKYVRSDLSGKIGLMEIVTDFDRVTGTFNVKEVVASSTAEGSPIVVFTASPDGAWHSLYYAQRVVKPVNTESGAGDVVKPVDTDSEKVDFESYLKKTIRAEVIAQFMQVKESDKLKERWTQIITKVTKEKSESVSDYASLSVEEFADKLIENGLVGYSLSEDGNYAWTYLPFFADSTNVDKISVGAEKSDSKVKVSYHHPLRVVGEASDWVFLTSLPVENPQDPESDQILEVFGVVGQERDIRQTVTEVVGPDVVVAASLGSEKKVAISWTFDGEDKEGIIRSMRNLREYPFEEEVLDVSVASNGYRAEVVVVVTLQSGEVRQLNVRRKAGLEISDSKIEGLVSEKSHIERLHDGTYLLTAVTSEGIVRRKITFINKQFVPQILGMEEKLVTHSFV